MSQTTPDEHQDTAIDARVIDGKIYVSAADLAAKLTEVAGTLDDLGPEVCLLTGNDAASLFRGWGAMLAELAGTADDNEDVTFQVRAVPRESDAAPGGA